MAKTNSRKDSAIRSGTFSITYCFTSIWKQDELTDFLTHNKVWLRAPDFNCCQQQAFPSDRRVVLADTFSHALPATFYGKTFILTTTQDSLLVEREKISWATPGAFIYNDGLWLESDPRSKRSWSEIPSRSEWNITSRNSYGNIVLDPQGHRHSMKSREKL